MDTERKRLAIRAWRRGTREADLLLGPWADARLADMDAAALAEFAALLDENDVDIAAWLIGLKPPPDRFARLVAAIAQFATDRAAARSVP